MTPPPSTEGSVVVAVEVDPVIYYSFLVVAFISHLRYLPCLLFLINIYGIMDISINLDYRKYGIGIMVISINLDYRKNGIG
jgi:hypothetical protein